MPTSSKYFKQAELTCHCKCGDSEMQASFLTQLDGLREDMGMSLTLTSAKRCQKHNKESGGAPSSQHLLGRAADIAWSQMSGEQKKKLVEKACERFRGIGFHPQFLHVDDRPGPVAVFFYPT